MNNEELFDMSRMDVKPIDPRAVSLNAQEECWLSEKCQYSNRQTAPHEIVLQC